MFDHRSNHERRKTNVPFVRTIAKTNDRPSVSTADEFWFVTAEISDFVPATKTVTANTTNGRERIEDYRRPRDSRRLLVHSTRSGQLVPYGQPVNDRRLMDATARGLRRPILRHQSVEPVRARSRNRRFHKNRGDRMTRQWAVVSSNRERFRCAGRYGERHLLPVGVLSAARFVRLKVTRAFVFEIGNGQVTIPFVY